MTCCDSDRAWEAQQQRPEGAATMTQYVDSINRCTCRLVPGSQGQRSYRHARESIAWLAHSCSVCRWCLRIRSAAYWKTFGRIVAKGPAALDKPSRQLTGPERERRWLPPITFRGDCLAASSENAEGSTNLKHHPGSFNTTIQRHRHPPQRRMAGLPL
jgi:hypothetical protein